MTFVSLSLQCSLLVRGKQDDKVAEAGTTPWAAGGPPDVLDQCQGDNNQPSDAKADDDLIVKLVDVPHLPGCQQECGGGKTLRGTFSLSKISPGPTIPTNCMPLNRIKSGIEALEILWKKSESSR
jgi:hypothetical protein